MDIYVGWIFLLSGFVGLVTMFFAPTVPAFLWALLTAALSLFCGILLLWHPVEGAISLTLVLIAFFVAEGVFQIAAAIRYRDAFPGSWGWMVMSGLSDLLLAGLIISGWPGSAAWALGLIVGINLITSGIAVTMVAIGCRFRNRSVGIRRPECLAGAARGGAHSLRLGSGGEGRQARTRSSRPPTRARWVRLSAWSRAA
ncbi:hypothetical protein GWG65_17230 [Bradyrhizobium sp. CSA207]|uniref:HdeD family acid-resistance protein n=1 Tax=Bradyrhizobium sp. CSA207 TaxID=2698826 RepID=UPI0023AE6F39|nr:DUF308 domain-containing protein [Bradyrhizobium sp. CSA207]MDE5443165.1 hypothetical protein [Bradyrhizobium sp. CSA207]